MADVASVEFSNPELVDVSKAESETTVGQIKESRGLECEYSAELTEEQITQINAQTVEAGDWALISMHPFTSEESLTVTMKNGDQFVVKVTDAQITANVLTADGERFRITVTYDDEANIPEGSVLVAEEILEGSDKYEKYLKEVEGLEDDDPETEAGLHVLEIAHKANDEIRAKINEVFGKDVCTPTIGDRSILMPAKGLPVWENLLLSIIDKFDSQLVEEKAKTNQRLEEYTKKYRRNRKKR